MILKRTLSALCMTAALSSFAAGYAVAADTIALSVTINTETQVNNLSADELRTMLAELGIDQRTIDQAVAAGLRDGKLSLEIAPNAPEAAK